VYIVGVNKYFPSRDPRYGEWGNRLVLEEQGGRGQVFEIHPHNNMGQVYTSFHTALSKKLGWDDMLAKVALPAIDKIIDNQISIICDCTGDVLSPDSVAAALLQDSWTPNDLFGLLVSPNYQIWEQEKELFISLRFEIEEWMRRGNSYEQSIAEWYK